MMDTLQNTLILFKGLPATGKSTLARRLSEQLDGELIIRDKLKTTLRKHRYPDDQLGRKSYALMWELADRALRYGGTCVCDTSLTQPSGIPDIEALRNAYQARVIIIECYCSERQEHLDRLQERAKFPSYYCVNSLERFTEFEQQNSQYKDFVFPYPTLRIDTSHQIDIALLAGYVKTISETGENGVVTIEPAELTGYGQTFEPAVLAVA
jgi:predicted kinase